MVIKNEEVLPLGDFIKAVQKRDRGQCVICGDITHEVSFVVDPLVFEDGEDTSSRLSQVMSNGVLLCEGHAYEAKTTLLSVQDIRKAAGMSDWSLPDTFEHDQEYDRYGNAILPSGQRMKGPWFFHEEVQKALDEGSVLSIFTDRVKMPRTFHMPWSEGRSDDDKVIHDMSIFEGREVVLTEKMDGENTCFYHDYIHARSIDGRHHPSRDWIKSFHASIAWQIPESFRIYVENLYARHSVSYHDLKSYCLGFHVWDGFTCLSYDESLEYLDMLGIEPVRELWRGIYDERAIRNVQQGLDQDRVEGTVLRIVDAFQYSQFRHSVVKQVRKDHVTTSKHWMQEALVPNELRR